jgi:hypothetical protein
LESRYCGRETFSKGIIHREATLTEFVTNMRVLCYDDNLKAIVRAAPLAGATTAVTNTRRDSTNMRTGFERYGMYSSAGHGTSITIGGLQFFVQGKMVFELSNVRDPFGLKRLIDGSLKSMRS